MLSYVDVCILFHKDMSVIDEVLKDLESPKIKVYIIFAFKLSPIMLVFSG